MGACISEHCVIVFFSDGVKQGFATATDNNFYDPQRG